MARKVRKQCPACQQLFLGRIDAIACSERCRKRLQRARASLVGEAKQAETKLTDAIKEVEQFITPRLATEAGFIEVAEPPAAAPVSSPTPTAAPSAAGSHILPTASDIAPAILQSPVLAETKNAPAFESWLDSHNADLPETAETYQQPGQSHLDSFSISLPRFLRLALLLMVLIPGVALGAYGGYSALFKHPTNPGSQSSLDNQAAGLFGTGSGTLHINYNTQLSEGKSFTATGPVVIQNDTDSTGEFKIQSASGGNILVADSVNQQINIGNKPPGQTALNVSGDITTNGALVSTTKGYSLSSTGLTLGGKLVCTANGCISSSSPPPTPNSPTIDVANLAYLNVNQTFSGINTFSGNDKFKGTNSFTGRNSFNNTSTSAFQVQNSSGSDKLFVVDTVNNRIGIGMTPGASGATVQIAGDLNVSSGVYKIGNVGGSSFACAAGEVLQQATVTGGIVTSGSCVSIAGGTTPTLQQVYSASTPADIRLSSVNGMIQIQDSASPLATDLFEVTDSSGSTKYFAINSLGISVTGNINTTGQYQINGTQISSSNLSDGANLAKLNANQTFTGANTFSNASNSFTGSGAGLSSLNATNISSGTLNNARLSAQVTLQGNTFNGPSQLVQLTAGGILPVLSGANLTNLNASAVASGTLSDARLSANVALLNANQTFTGNDKFTLSSAALSVQDASTPLGADLFTVTNNSGATKYFEVSATGVKINGSDVCTSAGNCVGTGGGGAIGGSGTAGKLAKFTGSGFTIGDSIITDNGTSASINGNVNTTGQYQVNGSQIASSNLSDGTNLAKLNANQTFTGANTFSNASNSFTGSGSGLTALNASNVSSGTLSDSRLSANVALLNANQTFTGNNTFALSTAGLAVQDAASPLGTNLFSITNHTGTTTYFSVSATALQFLGHDVCTTAGNCAGAGNGGGITGSGSQNFLSKFDAAGNLVNSIISDNGSTATVAGTLAVNTISPTATLTIGVPAQTLTLQGDGSTSLSAASGGFTNKLVFATPAVSNKTITLPNASGTVAVSASGPLSLDAAGNLTCPSCLTTNGSGGGAGVSSVNTLTGAITLAGTANQVIITPSSNTLTFSTPQDIATSSSPQFTNVDVTGQYKVNGSQIASTNLNDSNNLARLSANQTFTGANAFQSTGATAFEVQSAAGAETLLTVDSSARSAGGGNLVKVGNSTGTDANTTILVLDAAAAAPTSNLSALNGGLFYNSTDNKVSVIENGVAKELCNKTDLACGGNSTTLQNAYDNSSSPATIVTSSSTKNIIVQSGTGNNSASVFQIQDASGTSNLFIADTVHNRIAIDQATATYTLDVAGDINTTTGYRVGGTPGTTVTCSSGNVVQNATISGGIITGGTCVGNGAGVAPTLSQVYNNGTNSAASVLGLNSTAQGVLIRDNSTPIGGTLFGVQDSTGANKYLDVTTAGISVGGNVNTTGLYEVGGVQISTSNLSNGSDIALLDGNQTFTGNNIFQGTVQVQKTSTTAFQIQNATTPDNLFIADTTNHRIAIGQATATYKLDVAGDINTTSGFRVSGTPGSGITCSSGNVIQNAVVTGGIITGGSCVANGAGASLSLQNVYDDSPTPASIITSSATKNIIFQSGNSFNSTGLFQVQNAAGTSLLNVDSVNSQISINQSNLLVSYNGIPTGVGVAVGSNQGGSLSGSASSTYYYKVTAIGPNGESLPSSEVSINGASFTTLSIPGAPTVALGAAGNVTGTFTYRVTFVTANGETTVGTTSASISPSAQQVNLTNIPLGPTGTIGRNVYRCDNTGANCFRMSGSTTINNNTATILTDNTASYGSNPTAPGSNTATTNTNNASISWTAVTGATSYRIYRGDASGNEFAYQTSASSPFIDTGSAGTYTGSTPTYSAWGGLGIGTSAPAANLDVAGTAHFKNALDNTNALQIQNAAGSTVLNVSTATSFNDSFEGGTLSPLIQSSGTVTVGTSTVHSGTHAASVSSSSDMQLTRTLYTAGTISFWWIRTNAINSASFKVDGVSVATNTSGSWIFSSFAVGAGTHTFDWSDTGATQSVDDITVTNAGPALTANNGSFGFGTTDPGSIYYDVVAPTATNSAFQVQSSLGNSSVVNIDTTSNSLTVSQGNLTVTNLSSPSPPTLSSSSSGGTLAAATYLYELAATNVNGSTPVVVSSPTSVTTSGSTSQNTLNWSAVTNAGGYDIYRSTDGGTTWFKNSVSSSTTTLVDNGTNFTWSTSAAPPINNTTGGNLTVNGTGLFKNSTNSTAALNVQDATGASALNVDTQDRFVGINNANPQATLDVLASSSSFFDGFETGALAPFIGAAGWSATTGTTHSGAFSAGNTTNSNTLTLTRTLTAAGAISFWELGQSGCAENFQIDGVAQSVTGTGSYVFYSFALSSGAHTFTWFPKSCTFNHIQFVDDVTVTNTGAGTAALFNSGNVGIGTFFPSTTLDVAGTMHLQAASGGDSINLLQIQNSAGTDLFDVDSLNNKVGTSDTSTASTSSSSLVIQTGNASGSTSNSGNLTLDTGTATGTAGNISIGTGAYAHNISIGNQTGSSALTLDSGTGAINIGTGAQARIVNLGTGSAAQTVNIGSSTSSSSVGLSSGSGNIGLTAGSGSINLASGSGSVNITTNNSAASIINKSLTNGTQAFQVQNSAGSGVLVVDTTSNTTTFTNITVTGTCSGCTTGGASSDLQSDYNASGSPAQITLADAKDLRINAADTATDPSVKINLQCVSGCGSNGVFAVQNGGSNVFQVSPNGGGALFQNTSGLAFLNVNFSNSSIQVGSSTTDANAVLLVLDSYNSSTDPTGINGAMYYNTATNAFRCFVNSAWRNCGGNPPAYAYTSVTGAWGATTAKAATDVIVSPLYVPSQITVNNLILRVTTTLGAAGDVGVYDSNGNLVLNAGSSSVTTATGVKTLAPVQTGTARILEAGQYYVAVTWNSATGVIAGGTLGAAGAIPRSGHVTGVGGLVLPNSITLSSIVNDANIYAITVSN